MGEKENNKVRSELYLLGKGIIFIVSVITAIWFFGRAPFNEKVDARLQLFIDSPAMQVYIDGIIDRERIKQEKERAEKKSNLVKLRKLLSIKMGVDEDEVHIELGRQYKNEKEIKELINKMLTDIDKLKRKQNEGY